MIIFMVGFFGAALVADGASKGTANGIVEMAIGAAIIITALIVYGFGRTPDDD